MLTFGSLFCCTWRDAIGFILGDRLDHGGCRYGRHGPGGVVSCLFRKDSSRTVSLLLSFAAGVMTAVVCFDLLSEAVAPEGTADHTHLLLAAVGVMLGYAVTYLLNGVDRSGYQP